MNLFIPATVYKTIGEKMISGGRCIPTYVELILQRGSKRR